MKLIDILARELKVWPEGARWIEFDGGQGCYADMGVGYRDLPINCDEVAHASSVRESEWQAARDALVAAECAHSYRDAQGCPECGVELSQPAWNGEGLPPVGTVCEMQDGGGFWCEVEIFANFKESAFGWDDRSLVNYFSNEPKEFRPIRTAEQIAKAEREQACDEIYGVLRKAKRPDNRSDMAEALYDAGYRKQVAQ